MLVIDNAPLRSRVIRGCKQTLAALQRARAEWARFEAEDQPQFQRWYHSTFGVELSTIRGVRDELAELHCFVSLVTHISDWEGLSLPKAYRKAKTYRANPQAYYDEMARTNHGRHVNEFTSDGPGNGDASGQPGDVWREGSADRDGQQRSRPGRPSREEIEMLFQEWLRFDPDGKRIRRDPQMKEFAFEIFQELFSDIFETEYDGRSEDDHRAEPFDGPDRSSPDQRLKTLYRTLVRRLHPDFQKKADVRLINLWHDVQEAYQAQNLERLEALASMCEFYNSGSFEALSVSAILTAQVDLRLQTKSLRAQINECKTCDPAWDFARRDKKRFAREIQRSLKSEIQDLNLEKLQMERLLARWEGRNRSLEEKKRARKQAAGRRADRPPARTVPFAREEEPVVPQAQMNLSF